MVEIRLAMPKMRVIGITRVNNTKERRYAGPQG